MCAAGSFLSSQQKEIFTCKSVCLLTVVQKKKTVHSKPKWVSTSFLSFASQSIHPESEWNQKSILFAGFAWELIWFTSMTLLIVEELKSFKSNNQPWLWQTCLACGFCVVSYYLFFVFIVTLMRETENSPRFVILEIASQWFQYYEAFIVRTCARVCGL